LSFSQVIHAARTLAAHPVSKIAQENMQVFVDVWEAQVEELGKVLRLITAGGDPSKSKCVKFNLFYSKYLILSSGAHFLKMPANSSCPELYFKIKIYSTLE